MLEGGVHMASWAGWGACFWFAVGGAGEGGG